MFLHKSCLCDFICYIEDLDSAWKMTQTEKTLLYVANSSLYQLLHKIDNTGLMVTNKQLPERHK